MQHAGAQPLKKKNACLCWVRAPEQQVGDLATTTWDPLDAQQEGAPRQLVSRPLQATHNIDDDHEWRSGVGGTVVVVGGWLVGEWCLGPGDLSLPCLGGGCRSLSGERKASRANEMTKARVDEGMTLVGTATSTRLLRQGQATHGKEDEEAFIQQCIAKGCQ
ncbi:unnamed protein product [Lampetra planeri]